MIGSPFLDSLWGMLKEKTKVRARFIQSGSRWISSRLGQVNSISQNGFRVKTRWRRFCCFF